MYTYKVEDIFEDIDEDPDNVLMNIPPEVLEQMGWKEGDTLNIAVTDNNQISISLVKKEKDE